MTQEDIFVEPEDTWRLEKELEMQRARERNVPVVFLARAEYHVAAVEGRGVKTVENQVRERTGGQSGQGSAGPCKDRECFSERWRPLTRAVTCSDLHFKSSPCGVVD